MHSNFTSDVPSWRSFLRPTETLPRMVSTVFADEVGPFPQGNVLYAPSEFGNELPGNLTAFSPMYQYEPHPINGVNESALCNETESGDAA